VQLIPREARVGTEAQDTKTVSPFVFLSSVSWSRSSLGQTGSYADFRVTTGKSNNCSATSIGLQQIVSSPTLCLKYAADLQYVKSATFSGRQANVSFTNGTAQDNPNEQEATDSVVVHPDGTVFALQPYNQPAAPAVIGIDGETGAQEFRVTLGDYAQGWPLIVAGDGYAYVPYVFDEPAGGSQVTHHLMLLRLSSSGDAERISIYEWTCNYTEFSG
jgi:hypothetical protein